MQAEQIITSIQSHKKDPKGKWNDNEDNALRTAIELYGERHWKLIAAQVHGRTAIQCLHRWKKILRPGLTKGPWTMREDTKLREWITYCGPTRWAQCSAHIPGRNGKQCRERWFNNLCPDLKKGDWTKEEDELIYSLYHEIGAKWAIIGSKVPGRTENSVKNRFYSNMRKAAKAAEQSMEPKIESIKVEEPVEVNPFPVISNKKTKEQKMLSLLEHVKSLESVLSTTRFELLQLENEYQTDQLV